MVLMVFKAIQFLIFTEKQLLRLLPARGLLAINSLIQFQLLGNLKDGYAL
jgi:hypothetical protein